MENAVKYTQNGGVIKVNLQRQGRDAHFTVSDNGPGIPKENLPHIFDRFYRVDKARSREKGGTGLGLSIAQLIKENAHRLQPIADQKGQKIQLTLSDPCDIYADKSKLNQVIYNLMENAVKYTQNGGVIKVNLQRQGRDAHFTVSDNGPGIPKENLPHIFDRFYRVDKARSREKGGTGLGLSIVHQLVLLHGGAISVESEEGKGATFIVELPLHQG
jgi:signal transduction histidine kinase